MMFFVWVLSVIPVELVGHQTKSCVWLKSNTALHFIFICRLYICFGRIIQEILTSIAFLSPPSVSGSLTSWPAAVDERLLRSSLLYTNYCSSNDLTIRLLTFADDTTHHLRQNRLLTDRKLNIWSSAAIRTTRSWTRWRRWRWQLISGDNILTPLTHMDQPSVKETFRFYFTRLEVGGW